MLSAVSWQGLGRVFGTLAGPSLWRAGIDASSSPAGSLVYAGVFGAALHFLGFAISWYGFRNVDEKEEEEEEADGHGDGTEEEAGRASDDKKKPAAAAVGGAVCVPVDDSPAAEEEAAAMTQI